MNRYDKLEAKTTNEQLKIIATFVNTLGVGSLVGGGIAPLATGKTPDGLTWLFLIVAAVLLHLIAHLMLRFIVSEE